MKIYDTVIKSIYELLEKNSGNHVGVTIENDLAGNEGLFKWQDAGEYNMILRSEAAYELGGGTHKAISGLGFTSDAELVDRDEILIYGQDLPEIQTDISYARLTLVRLREDFLEQRGAEDKAYQMLRKVDYTRYHLNPKGYMMRISVSEDREPVRVSREALMQGMNFEKIGKMFIDEYHKNTEVLAVKLIFITLADFPYDNLDTLVEKLGRMTESLNHVLSNIKMDCSICGLKEVCDEVEELKELHFQVMEKD